MPFPSLVDSTWVNNTSGTTYDARELRSADDALFNGDGTAFGIYGGIVRHGDTSLAVTVNASDVVTVQPGAVVIPGKTGGVEFGCYRTALRAVETGSLTARNATNPRIDLLVFRQLDTDVIGSHGGRTAQIELIAGTPAASPAAPALPDLAVELARITVPASGGSTATVDSTFRRFAAALGGILPVATAARLPTAETRWDRAVAVDTGREYVWDGSAWQPRVGDWTSIPGWTGSQGSGFTPQGQYRVLYFDGTRRLLELRGVSGYGGGLGVNATLGTLPVGARPLASSIILAASNAFLTLNINADGRVSNGVAVQSGGFISIDNCKVWLD